MPTIPSSILIVPELRTEFRNIRVLPEAMNLCEDVKK